MKRKILLIIAFSGLFSYIYGNGLTLSSISVNQGASTVSFNVKWNNSWRVTGEPKNWDAIWLFVKFRDCNAQTSTPFTHGYLSSTVADHTFNDLEPIKSDGSGTGFDALGGNIHGVLLRRNNSGIYSDQAPTAITLKINNLPATGNLDVRVFGIEMVFIPQGSYYLGDGTGPASTAAGHADGNFQNTYADPSPVLISAETGISVYTAQNTTNTTYYFTGGAVAPLNTAIPDNFPKGYNGFHIMKYEITQQQYADFLNTISSAFWNVRYPGNYGSSRNQLASGGTYPNFYYSNRPYRAQNYLAWADLAAFLDWACLSPMSELQFEKVCRGPQPYYAGEYAWGNTFSTVANNITGTEDGTEGITGNCVYNNTTFTGGDGSFGPVRAGIFATSTTTTREATGASYYGVMELSGNVWEWCVMAVPASGGGVGPNPNDFTRQQWGDGDIDVTGNANVAPGWPSSTLATDMRTIVRGGGWGTSTTAWLQVSDRNFSYLGAAWTAVPNGPGPVYSAASTYNPAYRSSTLGGRGIR